MAWLLPALLVLGACECQPLPRSDVPCKLYVFETGQREVFIKGDDGSLRAGHPLPSRRFEDHGDGTVTDRVTGVTWLRNAGRFGRVHWEDAKRLAAELADDGKRLRDGSKPGDWRLPTVEEMVMLIDYKNADPSLPDEHPFTYIQHLKYWTSTEYSARPKGHAWNVSPIFGFIASSYDFDAPYHLWPVKREVKPAMCRPVNPAPTPDRFELNGDGTVTDHGTGLIWLADANALGQLTWEQAVLTSRRLASGQAGLSDDSKKGDWRLPNIRELQTLVDRSRSSPSMPEHQPFANVQATGIGYWSSTRHAKNYHKWTPWTQADDVETAYVTSLLAGYFANFYAVEKYDEQDPTRQKRHVWPVRGQALDR